MNRTIKEIGKEIASLVKEANSIYNAYQKLDVESLKKKHEEVANFLSTSGSIESTTIDKYKEKLANLKDRIIEREKIDLDYEEILKMLERHLKDSNYESYNKKRMDSKIMNFNLTATTGGANKATKHLKQSFNDSDLETLKDLINYLCKLKTERVKIIDGRLVKGIDLEFGERLRSTIANKSVLSQVLANTSQTEFIPSEMLKYYAFYCFQ